MGFVPTSQFAVRPTKRRQDVSENMVAVKKRKGTDKRLYFDHLPENAIENIIRWLSKAPREMNWFPYVMLEDILLIMSVQGDLGSFARARFKSICIGDIAHGECHDRTDYNLKVKVMTDMIWFTKCDAALRVFDIAGEAFKTIVVGGWLGKRLQVLIKQDENFGASLNVRNMAICGAYEFWLKRFGSRLHYLSLGISGKKALFCASTFCINLKQLQLAVPRGRDLQGHRFWERLGKTLEKLWVTFLYRGCGEEVLKITEYCRKLTHIHVEDEENVNEVLTKCLESYGPQLEHAYLPHLNESQVKRVVDSCTKCKFSVLSTDGIVHSLSLGGSRIIGAITYAGGVHSISPEMVTAWNLCSNLKCLFLHDVISMDLLKTVFLAPKAALERLEVAFDSDDPNRRPIKWLDIIANGTRALRHLAVKCSLPSPFAFVKIVQRNPELRIVQLLNMDGIYDYEMLLVEIVKSLLKAKELANLLIEDTLGTIIKPSEKLKQICNNMKVRERRLCINVGGVDYLR